MTQSNLKECMTLQQREHAKDVEQAPRSRLLLKVATRIRAPYSMRQSPKQTNNLTGKAEPATDRQAGRTFSYEMVMLNEIKKIGNIALQT